MIKKLDKLLLKSYVGPLVLTFFIALFVFVMQFLWKYVDDLIGKGLDTVTLVELMFYASATFVPMVLPLAVLLASIMTFGNMGEHYELTAAKSAGISLFRVMRPLFLTVLFISAGAFIFSNNLLPKANLKFARILYDIRHQKPALSFKPGFFNKEIDGYSIRVDDKDEDGKTLYGLLIYDFSTGKGLTNRILAEKAIIQSDESGKYMDMTLYNGTQFKREQSKDNKTWETQHYRTKFVKWKKRFDLSDFQLNETDEKFFKNLEKMMTVNQLIQHLDTVETQREKKREALANYIRPYYLFTKYELDKVVEDSVVTASNLVEKDIYSLFKGLETETRIAILNKAISKVRNVQSYAGVSERDMKTSADKRAEHLIEIHRKFTLSVACMVLFFIGAPLGSIIRKGGLGWPLFWAIIFFVILHVSSIIGEKMCEAGAIPIYVGMWVPTLILLPIGVFLTIKAKNDSQLFNARAYVAVFQTFVGRVIPKRRKI